MLSETICDEKLVGIQMSANEGPKVAQLQNFSLVLVFNILYLCANGRIFCTSAT